MSRRIFDRPSKVRSAANIVKRAARKTKGETLVGSLRTEFEPNFAISRVIKVKEVDTARNGLYLHVSDLLHNCVRKKALQVRLGTKEMNKFIKEEDAIMYAMGHAAQNHLTKRLKASVPEELYGVWACKCGRSTIDNTTLDKASVVKCQHCDTIHDQYREVTIVNDEYYITGSIDIIFSVDGALYLNEIKSMVRELWEGLTQPVPEHILQIYMYYWLMVQNKTPVHDRVSVIYVNKGYKWGLFPYKEYPLQPSKEYISRIQPLLALAKSYKDAVIDPKAPLPKRPCASTKSTAATSCSMCTLCFQLD